MLKRVDLRGATGDLARLLPRPAAPEDLPVAAVGEILAAVRENGDAALRELTARFDKVELDSLRVDPSRIAAAAKLIPSELAEGLHAAHDQVEAFYRRRAEDMGMGIATGTVPEGSPPGSENAASRAFDRCGINVVTRRVPVSSAGMYVPGGRAKYPSTVMMTAVPARVAGVERIALCVPPGPDGMPPTETLAAAHVCGVDEVYRIGGAQAIAAMAYGTESVRAVDVIAGPGNIYVSIAKQLVSGAVGVPGAFAGPSEVVVVADDSSSSELCAIDLVVQAEHGPDGLAWLVTWSPEAADAITEEVERLVAASPRRADIEATLATGGFVALVDSAAMAMEVVNIIAPEHLELATSNAAELVSTVRNAGAVFVGSLSPASMGDYVAGPSHVLPTNATARFSGALGLADFTKEMSIVSVSQEALDDLGRAAVAIADAEGLPAHAESIRMRWRS